MPFIERLINALEEHKIKYAIVGGVAVALHGAPRGTIDIDVVIKHTEKNFRSIEYCLKQLGFSSRIPVKAEEIYNFKEEFITRRNLIAWSFYNPQNPLEVVDIILTHDLSMMKSVTKKFGLKTLKVLAVKDLIKMKKDSNRPQDREDIKVLMELYK